MKKSGLLMFLLLLLFVFAGTGRAEASGTKIYLDGEPLNLSSDVQVANINNSIMIPIRVVSENLGYKVEWNKASQTVSVQNSSKTVIMGVNQKEADVNGNIVSMSIPPLLQGNTTLVPLRFVSSEMGMDVKWDNLSKAVYLSSAGSMSDPWASEPPLGSGSVISNPGNQPEAPSGPSNPTETPDINNLSTVDAISFMDNRLMVALSGSVTPKVSTLTGPERIVIDLPSVKFSDTFVNSNPLDAKQHGQMTLTGYPDVKSVRYSLFSNNPSTVRIVLDLNYSKGYTVSGTENGSGLLMVDLNTADPGAGSVVIPPAGSSGKKTVVIDAGHGDNDPGAVSPNKRREKDFNLSMALKVGKLLEKEKGIDVVLTRSNDTFLELRDRVKIANNLKADVFVSIHGNSNPSSSPNGTETFYTRDSSLAFAKIMHEHLAKGTGLKNRGVSKGNFHVTRETVMPAALLEVGFLSNKGDEAQMFNEEFQNVVAQSIVNGIKEYLKVQ
ncbi:N-acetylmuramoyl-L-alanine amidase family protein [Paenibacillus lemnae]|uniref:AMIN domain-containing protein n=1 Tax=Paenibacillus lemnae TaxID=1330551 RepID=A0A848MEZ8_PAELE|nr:N-acetylmuramoyl-L-alanine amidase family protein [Paenibacillus lemnae]NMO97984.1 AMIN domain-containing protein [Paenibacillus lemnae]